MTKFELPVPTELFLSKFQTRNEKHGDVDVTAMDMAVQWTTSNKALDMLHPLLRQRLCSNVPPEILTKGDQGMMDLGTEELAFVMFKRLGMPQKWDLELTRYTLIVDWGTQEEYMAVSQCKLHKFEFELLDGGSTLITWTISSSADLTEEFVGHMGMQQQKKIYIKLLAPLEGTIDASESSDAPKSKPGRKKKDKAAGEPANGAGSNGEAGASAGAGEGDGGAVEGDGGEGGDGESSHPDPATAAFIDSQQGSGAATS